jgi:hypothetical protein
MNPPDRSGPLLSEFAAISQELEPEDLPIKESDTLKK